MLRLHLTAIQCHYAWLVMWLNSKWCCKYGEMWVHCLEKSDVYLSALCWEEPRVYTLWWCIQVFEFNATRHTERHKLCTFSEKLLLDARFWPFDFSGSWSWRAAASAVRCVCTTAPKASSPTLRCSLTAWLMTSGTRSLWPSAPLMLYCTSTATGKMLRMNMYIRYDDKISHLFLSVFGKKKYLQSGTDSALHCHMLNGHFL